MISRVVTAGGRKETERDHSEMEKIDKAHRADVRSGNVFNITSNEP